MKKRMKLFDKIFNNKNEIYFSRAEYVVGLYKFENSYDAFPDLSYFSFKSV